MRTMLAAIALLLCAGFALAGEEAKPPESAIPKMDAKIKAERIEKVTRVIATEERILATLSPQYIERCRQRSPKAAEEAIADKARAEAALPPLRIELRWLKGELTPVGTAKALTDAQAALDKAKEAKQPTEALEKALAQAVMENSEVQRLEAAARPKAPEPEAAATPQP